MSRLLPFRTPVDREESEPRVVGIDNDAADEVFAALSSETARGILNTLYEEPRTASDLAEAVDTTLQNVRYHLENLQEAGLIEVADTWYSSRGTEMKVYAPADSSVVLFAGDESTGPTIREALGRLVQGIGVLALASVLVQRLVSPPPVDTRDGADLATATDTQAGDAGPTPGPTDEATGLAREEVATETATVEPTTTTDAETATVTPARMATETPTGDQTRTTTELQQTGTELETQTATERATQTATEITPPSTVVDQANVTNTTTLPVETTTSVTETTTFPEVVETTGQGLLAGLQPGLVFFLGGAFALTLAVGWWYWQG